jgi:hypothetical protein
MKIAVIKALRSGMGFYGTVEFNNIEIGFREDSHKSLEQAIAEVKKLGAERVIWSKGTPQTVIYDFGGTQL